MWWMMRLAKFYFDRLICHEMIQKSTFYNKSTIYDNSLDLIILHKYKLWHTYCKYIPDYLFIIKNLIKAYEKERMELV
jgi:hypothetical protein